MQGVQNDLLFALDHAGCAAHALRVVNNGMIVNDAYGSHRAGSFAFAAGDAAEAAGIAHGFLVLL